MTGALDGIRVIDLTSVVFGPYATMILGDLGADVIKVEPPEGDVLRYPEPARHRGMGAIFMNTNRNKRSVMLDLKTDDGRAALLDLVATADVFVHSMRPKAIAGLALTYDDLRTVKPDIIHASAIGFSSEGPYADRPAYDDIIQSMSGLAHLAQRRGDPAPAYAPTIVGDKTSGQTLVWAIMAALIHRLRTGQGQAVEVPMFETLTSYVLVEHLNGGAFRPQLGQIGYERMLSPDRRPYPTADGHVTILPYTSRHWASFFALAGRPAMLDDPRVTDPAVRSRRIGELYALVAALTPARTSADWLAACAAADIPAAPVNTLEDLTEDPHLAATGFFVDMAHPTEGAIRTTAVPVRFSATPGDPARLPAPHLGEHTGDLVGKKIRSGR